MLLHLGVNALAGVADGEQDVGAGAGLEILRQTARAEMNVGSLDGEGATGGHGIARIGGQVEDYLLDPGGVCPDGVQVGGEGGLEMDILSNDAMQQAVHAGQYLVEVEDAYLHGLAAGEGQEVPGEMGGALARAENPLDVLAEGLVGLAEGEDDLGGAVDDLQEVVKVVGHAAGQAPYGLHLGRLAEVPLELDPLADVKGVDVDIGSLGDGREGEGKSLLPEGDLRCSRPSGGEGLGDGLAPDVGEGVGDLTAPQVEEGRAGIVGVEDGAISGDPEHGVGVLPGEAGQGADLLLSASPLGDVSQDRLHANDLICLSYWVTAVLYQSFPFCSGDLDLSLSWVSSA